MRSVEIQYHSSSIGDLILGSFDNKLCLLDFQYRNLRESIDRRIRTSLEADYTIADNELLQETRAQVDEYLGGTRKVFELPILMVGTKFQKTVWMALQDIGYGETCSYLELSRRVGDEKSIRAVAAANGANAISLVIPCHRIIGINGEMIGYGGGVTVKKKLLQLERAAIFDQLELDL